MSSVRNRSALTLALLVSCAVHAQDAPVPRPEVGPVGLEVAAGFVLEELLPGLFDESDRPRDIAFDADGVPYVAVSSASGTRVVRVTDPGGVGRAAVGTVIFEASSPFAPRLLAGPGESLWLTATDADSQRDAVRIDPVHGSSERVARGPGWSGVRPLVGLVGGDVLGLQAGKVRLPPAALLRSAARGWSGNVFALNRSRELVDGLQATEWLDRGRVARDLALDPPAGARSAASSAGDGAPLLVLAAPGWLPGAHVGPGLLVAEPAGRRVTRIALREDGLGLVPAAREPLVRAPDGVPFAPAVLRHGPGGGVWILDADSARVLRLRPAGTSGRIEQPLRSAERGELLLALRAASPERRAMAQRLLLERAQVVHPQDRALALLDALQRGVPPAAAAALDELLALRGAPLPKAEPTLDGGRLERLARHQVRLDLHREAPLAARRLLPRWLECAPRTRHLVARTLANHPGATDEERGLARAYLSLPESTTRVVGLFDEEYGEQFGAVFLHHLAPLGVEYVEALDSLDALFPRLADADVLVLASARADYTPLWRALIDAHLARGGGVVVPTFLNDVAELGSRVTPSAERRARRDWLHALAAYRPRPGLMCVVGTTPARVEDELPAFADVPSEGRVLVTTVGSPLDTYAPGDVHVVARLETGVPALLARDLSPGRVVTSLFSFGALGEEEDFYGPLLRAMVTWAGAGRAR